MTTKTKVKKAVRKALKVELQAKKREAKATGDPAAVAQADQALEALRSRKCIRPVLFGVPACEKTFVPELRGAGMLNQYCSGACAMLALTQRENEKTGVRWTPKGTIAAMLGGSDDPNAPRAPRAKRLPPARRESDPAALAALEAKWGPMRAITAVVEARASSKKVTLECGHTKTVSKQAKNGRCERCKLGREGEPAVKGKKDKKVRKAAAPRPEKASRGRGLGDEVLTKKYGPMQPIKRVLSTTAGAKRVALGCGHEKTLAAAAKQGRCERCRDGLAASAPRRVSVKKVASKPKAASEQAKTKTKPAAAASLAAESRARHGAGCGCPACK